jgi:hypothetical protein
MDEGGHEDEVEGWMGDAEHHPCGVERSGTKPEISI